MDAQRALLDELMGKDRNKPSDAKPSQATHFSDPEICKHFLCGFCPNELFINTKSDLGPCHKVHDEALRQQFQESKRKDSYPYERDFIRYLERLIDELDRRVKKGMDRLDIVQDPVPDAPMSAITNEKVKAITERIQALLKQIEDLGEEGKIDESQELMKYADQLKAEKELIIQNEMRAQTSNQDKRMKVCDICGAFLVVGDTEKRISSHLDGKQHIGYELIRKTLADYKKSHRDERPFKDDRGGRRRDDDYRRDDRDRYRDRDYDNRRRDNNYRRKDRDSKDDDFDQREHKRHR